MNETAKQNNGVIQNKASPEIIFKALTEARELVRWFCDRATSDPREGGELTAYWKTGKTSQKGRAVFKRIAAGSQVQLLWIDDGQGSVQDPAHHLLSYSIKVKRGTSEVTMQDEDSPLQNEEIFSFIDQGWNAVLLELKDYCERKERSTKRPAKSE